MLTGLRKHATGIVAQIFLGLLGVSFVIWGVSDVFRGFVSDTVARVGGEKITTVAFQRAYDSQLRGLSQQFGRQITAEQARTIGVPDQVLNILVSQASLNQQARAFGLGITNEGLRAQIYADRTFFGPSGQFDRSRFDQLLSTNNLNEPLYVADRRQQELRQQIVAAVTAGRTMPDIYKRAFHEYGAEERAVRYFVLPRSLAGEIPAPTDDELKAYFAENKQKWGAPEYRGLIVLPLDAAELAKTEEVSDADARAAYDRQKERFTVPERRNVRQLLFKNKEEADAASAKLKAGTTFDALVEELKRSPQDVNLGMVARSGIVDKAVADAAFSLNANQVSDVVQGRFGPVIVAVGEIEGGKETPFEEVKDKVKADLAKERAATKLLGMQDQIEDLRAGGSTLSEAAAKLGLTAQTFEAIDRQSKTPDGTAVTVPGGERLIADAFNSDVGIDNDPQPYGDRGAIWYEVTKVDAARDRALDEVKDKVVEAWRQAKTDEKLDQKARELADKIRNGGDIEAVAKEAGLTVAQTPALTRRETPANDLTQEVIAAAFSGKEGTVAVAPGKDGSRVVLRVDATKVPDMPADDAAATDRNDRVNMALSQDLLQSYTELLQRQLGVSIDRTVMQQALGTSGPAG